MARHGIAKKATRTGVVGGGGWEVASPAHPLHWRNLRHPLAMSPREDSQRRSSSIPEGLPGERSIQRSVEPIGIQGWDKEKMYLGAPMLLPHSHMGAQPHASGRTTHEPAIGPDLGSWGDPPTFPHRHSGHPGLIPGLSFPSAESFSYSFLSQGSCSQSQG